MADKKPPTNVLKLIAEAAANIAKKQPKTTVSRRIKRRKKDK